MKTWKSSWNCRLSFKLNSKPRQSTSRLNLLFAWSRMVLLKLFKWSLFAHNQITVVLWRLHRDWLLSGRLSEIYSLIFLFLLVHKQSCINRQWFNFWTYWRLWQLVRNCWPYATCDSRRVMREWSILISWIFENPLLLHFFVVLLQLTDSAL